MSKETATAVVVLAVLGVALTAVNLYVSVRVAQGLQSASDSVKGVAQPLESLWGTITGAGAK